MRHTRQAIEGDIVFARHFEQSFLDFLAEIPSVGKLFLKRVNCFVRALQEFDDFVGAGRQFFTL